MHASEIPLLFEDEHLVAVHKPAGLLVHSNAHARREPFLLQLLRDQLGRRVYPVHRLDRATSGLLIMALTTDAAGILARQFANREARKVYMAMVRGFITESGVIDSPLRAESGRECDARTEFECVHTSEIHEPVGRYASARFSLVRVTPQTGRTHQIRRHFAHIRHPIIGDVLRGDGRQNRFFRERFGLHRLMLASIRLEVRHPEDGRMLPLTCPLAPELALTFRQLGWEDQP